MSYIHTTSPGTIGNALSSILEGALVTQYILAYGHAEIIFECKRSPTSCPSETTLALIMYAPFSGPKILEQKIQDMDLRDNIANSFRLGSALSNEVLQSMISEKGDLFIGFTDDYELTVMGHNIKHDESWYFVIESSTKYVSHGVSDEWWIGCGSHGEYGANLEE